MSLDHDEDDYDDDDYDDDDDDNDKSKRVLSVSLTSSRQNCNFTKDFTFIVLSRHVSTTGVLFTWWFV